MATNHGVYCLYIIKIKKITILEFKSDTQLLIEGKNLNEDEISEYFTTHFKGNYLLAVEDD